MVSNRRWALMAELRGADEPPLAELIGKLSPVDLVIVEGFKTSPLRKIEVHRAANAKPLLFPGDASIAAIATDAVLDTALPVVGLEDIAAIAALVMRLALPVAAVTSGPAAEPGN